jgi:peptidoglycan/xylan/chitin deacetylase (PgdA/CDA1 family)
LTFDDGYRDNYTYAFPLARLLHMPITIFVVPGYVESGEYFWWGEGQRLVCRASVNEIDIKGHTYQLQCTEDRELLVRLIDEHLRHATSVAEREDFLKTMCQQLAVPTSVLPDEEGELPFNWEQMCEMEQSGWVSFGAHTMHHPVLSYLKDASEVQFEVGECRRVLEQQLGHPVRTFAYPMGRFEHIGATAVQAVKGAGYDWAVTTVHGINTPFSDPDQLGRVLGDVTRNWLVMAAEVSGLWSMLSPLWKRVIGKGEGV